jgi:hypothetical protein
MLILFASVLLLLIHHGQCAMMATANVQLHLTTTSIGTLTFVQNDANSPVVITGTLTSLNASSNLVCLIKQRLRIIFIELSF